MIGAGGGVVVTLVKIGPNQVRVGIEASQDVKVYREELLGASVPTPAPAVEKSNRSPRRTPRALTP